MTDKLNILKPTISSFWIGGNIFESHKRQYINRGLFVRRIASFRSLGSELKRTVMKSSCKNGKNFAKTTFQIWTRRIGPHCCQSGTRRDG